MEILVKLLFYFFKLKLKNNEGSEKGGLRFCSSTNDKQ